MFLIRGIESSVTRYAVRDWEEKLTPSLIDSLQQRRKTGSDAAGMLMRRTASRSGANGLALPRHRSEWRSGRREIPARHATLAAAKAFFRSAKTVTGVGPARVTTDGHDSYPRAIRTELGKGVKHRTNRYLNNRIEQDHRGVKGRYGPMRGFKNCDSAARFSRGFDELRNHLYPRSRRSQNIPTNSRRQRFLQRGVIALRIMEAA